MTAQKDALDAYHTAKTALENYTKLSYTSVDESTTLTLTTDSSNTAIYVSTTPRL